jgi:hypothetical protein
VNRAHANPNSLVAGTQDFSEQRARSIDGGARCATAFATLARGSTAANPIADEHEPDGWLREEALFERREQIVCAPVRSVVPRL